MKAQNTDYFDFAPKLCSQQIFTKPIMDIAARFWEDERYDAANICYKSMRVIDDLIDDRKAASHSFSEVEKQKLTTKVNDWVEVTCSDTRQGSVQKQLEEVTSRFKIPQWPWKQLSKSMIYDIHHDGFRTFPIFLRYAEGAAVAPASVFLHLCSVRKENGRYHAPQFDVRNVARPAGLFCYLVHIIRDFQKDQSNNLNYFASSLMAENGLSAATLKEVAAGGEISPGFRNLMKRYYSFAESYRHGTRRTIDKIGDYLKPRYRLSLEIVYDLYLLIFKKIDVLNGRFTTAELTPSPEEVKDRVNLTISAFESTR